MEHNFRAPIDEMTDQQKEWFAMAMVAVVLADGKVSESEVESLINSISFVTDPTAVDRLKTHIRFGTAPAIPGFSGWEADDRKRAAMMLDLIQVAIADAELSEQDKELFYGIGKILDFDRGIVRELFIAADKIMME